MSELLAEANKSHRPCEVIGDDPKINHAIRKDLSYLPLAQLFLPMHALINAYF